MTGLFRDAPIDSALSQEKLNKQINMITPSFFMLSMALFCMVLTAVAWCMFATIPISTEMKGVIFPQDGIVTVATAEEGVVNMVHAGLGDYIRAGDIIAYMPQTNTLNDIKKSTDSIEIEKLRREYQLKSMIVSPADGQVIGIAGNGQYLKAGDEIAKIVQDDIYTNNQEITAFASQNEAKSLKKGMAVQISPDFAPREKYGYMEGIIIKIMNYPSKPQEIVKRFGGFISEADLTGVENYIEVKISISVDPDSKNLKKWSNVKGKDLDVEVGTKCNISVITDRIKPIQLLY